MTGARQYVVDDLDAVVERLRLTRDWHHKGRSAGVLWARDYATFYDLEQICEDPQAKRWRPISFEWFMCDGVCEYPSEESDVDEGEVAWWQGFSLGAIQVREAVRERLEEESA
jgi:hypothetical protein